MAKASQFLDSSTGGGFGGGGSSSGGGQGVQLPPPDLRPGGDRDFWVYSTGTSFTIPEYFSGTLYIDPTGNIDVTVNTSAYGRKVEIVHAGTANTITLKGTGGATMATLGTGQELEIGPAFDGSGAPVYGTGTIVRGSDGRVYLGQSIVFRSSSVGVMLKSPDGHWWLLQVDNAGNVTRTDQGTSEPPVI